MSVENKRFYTELLRYAKKVTKRGESFSEFPGLSGDFAYGRMRASLLKQVRRNGTAFASHDPDGHALSMFQSEDLPRSFNEPKYERRLRKQPGHADLRLDAQGLARRV